MVMKLKPISEQALRDWLNKSSWNTPHTYDMNRFYDFVHALWQEYQGMPSESEMQDLLFNLVRGYHQNFQSQTAKEVISARLSLASDIFAYLKHTESKS
jgi:hypothetical protein